MADEIRTYISEQQLKDYLWFSEHYHEIYHKYGECHVVIQYQKIVGIFSSFRDAFSETIKTLPVGLFSIQHCTGTEDGLIVYL